MYGCCNLCDIIRWYALKRKISPYKFISSIQDTVLWFHCLCARKYPSTEIKLLPT